MKLLSVFIFSLLALNNCDSQSLEDLTLNYNAETRGSSITLDATSSEIQYSDHKGSKTISITEEQWNEIIGLVSEIDVHAIQNLKAPSEGSHADRALVATLRITIGEETYESNNFDHGNPPVVLKKLIDRLFQLSE